MIDLAILVVSVALADSLNPATVVPALYLATGPRPARAVTGFAVGFFLVNVGVGLVVLAVGRRAARLLPHPGPHATHVLELVVGVLAIAAALVLWRRRHAVGAGVERSEGVLHRWAPLAGSTLAAIELPTAVPYFAVLAALSASEQPVGFQVAMVVLFNVIFLAPVAAIAVVCAVAGRHTQVLATARALVVRHSGSVVAVVVFLLGVVLLTLGALGLWRS